MNHILSFALALAVATALLPLCARYAALFGLLDADTQERKIHKGIVPRSGGIGIVAGAVIAFLVWIPAVDVPVPLLCAISVIVIFGLLDDRFDLPPVWQLAAQGTAAMIVIISYGGFHFLPWMGIQEVSAWVCVPITFVFIVGITNAVNLSDGLDGLAAGNSLLSFIVLAGLAYKADLEALSVFAMAIAGGLMGFLRFNTHPAKMFMGDTGSQFLGFAAAALCVLIFQSENLAISAALPLLIFALPVLDTLSVMAVRLVRGRPIFAADRSHLHHQLMRIGFRHYEVVVILYGLQAIAVIIAWLLRYESDTIVFLSYCLYCAIILGSILGARLLEWQPRPPNRGRGTKRERRNLFLRRYHWLHQNAHKAVVIVIAAFFLAVAVTTPAAARVGEAGLLAAGGLLMLWTLLRNHDEWVSRLIVFAASAVLVYGSLIDPESRVAYNWMIDGYLALVVLTLGVAVRVTRRDIFRLDSQDYLVLVIIGFVPVLMINQFDPGLVVRVSLRLAVILYAAEFVLTASKSSSKQALNAVALISIGLASV